MTNRQAASTTSFSKAPAIADYVHAQGLTDRRVMIEELFAPATLDL